MLRKKALGKRMLNLKDLTPILMTVCSLTRTPSIQNEKETAPVINPVIKMSGEWARIH